MDQGVSQESVRGLLHELGGSIATLERLLAQERAAIAALDPEALARITQEKQAALEQLRLIIHPPVGMAPRGPAPAIKAAAARLLGTAQANLALLDDAIGAVGEALGLRQRATTYDARARLRTQVRSFTGRRV